MIKLPFGWLPGHWGLKGKTAEIAKAEYELTGYELQLRLLEINKDELTETEYQTKLIDIDYKFGKCTQNERLRALAGLIEDEVQRKLSLLELDHKEQLITELQYQKEYHNLKKLPWVNVVNIEVGGKSSMEGSFELDWNDYFVEQLREAGYQAPTPDAVVNQWFMELCRNVAMEEFDGTGNFTADSEANLEALRRWSSESMQDGRKGYK